MYAANTSILEILTLLIYNVVLISGAASSSLVGMLETIYTLKRTYWFGHIPYLVAIFLFCYIALMH